MNWLYSRSQVSPLVWFEHWHCLSKLKIFTDLSPTFFLTFYFPLVTLLSHWRPSSKVGIPTPLFPFYNQVVLVSSNFFFDLSLPWVWRPLPDERTYEEVLKLPPWTYSTLSLEFPPRDEWRPRCPRTSFQGHPDLSLDLSPETSRRRLYRPPHVTPIRTVLSPFRY